MADPASWLAIAAVGTLVGAGVSAAGSIYAGQKSRESQQILAAQEEDNGKADFAAAQRESRERALENKLIMSRQQAIAAASGGGGGADAPTIVSIMSKTAERGRYGQDSVLYQGEAAKRGAFRSADARRRTGENNFIGSLFTAGGTLAGGLGDVGRIYA